MKAFRSFIPGTLFVAGASFTLRLLAMHQGIHANGWDAYFYINQTRAWIEDGQMHVPDASLIYPLLRAVYFFTGDYVAMYRITVSLLAAMFSAGIVFLAWRWSASFKAAMVIGCWSIFSPQLTYFAAQYPKNLLGVVCFIALLAFASPRANGIQAGLLILNLFGHRLTAVLSFAYFASYKFIEKIRVNAFALLTLVLLVFAAGWFIPGLLNFLDVGRLRGIFLMRPQFAPYSFLQTFGEDLVGPFWAAEIVFVSFLFAGVAAYAVVAYRAGADSRRTALLIVLFLLIFPFLAWTLEGIALRMFLVFGLLSPVLLLYFKRAIENTYVAGSLCVLMLVAGIFSFRSYNPVKHDPPYALYEVIARGIRARLATDSCELIVAHKSLAEFIVYATRIEAMSWNPDYQVSVERCWRIAYGPADVQYRYYLAPDDLRFVYRLTPSYSLIRNDIWQKFMTNIRRDNNDELLASLTGWRNPDQVRPAFLRRRP